MPDHLKRRRTPEGGLPYVISADNGANLNLPLPSDLPTKEGKRPAEAPQDVLDFILPDFHEEASSGTADRIQEIFNLGISHYKPTKDHTGSDGTRGPAHYDMHLDPFLRPNKVVYCPEIIRGLSNIANDSLAKYWKGVGSLPACSATDPAEVAKMVGSKRIAMVGDEAGIVTQYGRSIPDAILPIVSALVFQVPSWETRHLQWATHVNKDYAVPDGYRPPHASGVDELDDSFVMRLKNVEHYFPHVLLYEFKSLESGSYEHMVALLECTRTNDVEWKGCNSKKCKHSGADIPVTGSRTGADARYPLLDLRESDWKETEIGRSIYSSKPLVKLMSKHYKSAKSMIQQMWAEMVKHDATFIVLNAGNYEQIGYRHRFEQKFFLSGPIIPSEPGYVRLHVGLCIAAIYDAIDRAEQAREFDDGTKPHPASWHTYERNPHKTVSKIATAGGIDLDRALLSCTGVCLMPPKGHPSAAFIPRLIYHRRQMADVSGEVDLNLKINIHNPRDDNVYSSSITLGTTTFADCVVIKTARGKKSYDALYNEALRYDSLLSTSPHCKIPALYGFFHLDPDGVLPYAILLLENVGETLDHSIHTLTRDNVDGLLRTLQNMHDRNYVHGNLTESSIIISRKARRRIDANLVGLGRMRARMSDDERIQEVETLSELCDGRHKRPRGECRVLLGPIPLLKSSRPKFGEAFEAVTEWIKEDCPASTELSRCVGWADDRKLLDYLIIECLSKVDEERFREVWKRRPAGKFVHMKIRPY